MVTGKAPEFKWSEITPREKFLNRRNLIFGGLAAAGLAYEWRKKMPPLYTPSVLAATKLPTVPGTAPAVNEAVTPQGKATSYNNFYEFGTDKGDPKANAGKLHTRPWTVKIDGLVNKPQTIDIDALMHYRPLEDRTYRFRCVEAWSMVIPWVGYSLSELIKFADPKPSAKYVQFYSLADRKQMDLPGGFDWPYVEGLRMDEAMHPLTLLTFGAYGQTLENQQGAPVRVIVPWKYGFKSAKSIVRIRFTDTQPATTWNEMAAQEYGFYANVNPAHSHPRWSQAHERRIDGSTFPRTISTLPFNGYANEVASLYSGMDLNRYY